MKTLQTVFAVAIALVAQSVVARMTGPFGLRVDLVLVAVITVALLHGRVAGLLGGTLAGLAQDALAGGVMGIGGMATSLVGFLAGTLGTQFIVTQMVPRFLLFVGATGVHSAVFMGLYQLLGVRRFGWPLTEVALQALLNATAGIVLFGLIEYGPGFSQRWRVRRERRQKVRYR